MVSKWKELGEALGIDEDDIDEIDTGNEFDEGCLNQMLERFVIVHHNWRDVVAALREIEEKSLAENIEKQHQITSKLNEFPALQRVLKKLRTFYIVYFLASYDLYNIILYL